MPLLIKYVKRLKPLFCHRGCLATGHGRQYRQYDDELPNNNSNINMVSGKCIIFSSKAPGKCLHLESGDGVPHNGTKLHLWDLQPGSWPAQEWIWDGDVIKSAAAPGKCLHLESGTGDAHNGTKVHLWDLQAGSFRAQEWILDGGNIVSKRDQSKCCHLDGGHTGNGTKIQVWDAKNHENGTWKVEWLDGGSSTGKSDTERIVWLKMSAKELMSKDCEAGKMTFNEKVSIGCTTDMSIAAKVYGEVQGKANYAMAEVSGKAGFEVSGSFAMKNSAASETTKCFEMPEGSTGYIYQMTVETQTSKGNYCAWDCNIKMTSKPMSITTEQTFD